MAGVPVQGRIQKFLLWGSAQDVIFLKTFCTISPLSLIVFGAIQTRNQDFATRNILCSKMCYLCEATEQLLVQLKSNTSGDLGAKPPATGRFLQFFGKNIHFNAIWITFCTFLEQIM